MNPPTAEELRGFICVFYASPSDVIKGVVQRGARRLVGTVERATPALPKRNGIPGYALTIRGRSGKVMMIDQVDNYALFFLDWESAMIEHDKPIPQ